MLPTKFTLTLFTYITFALILAAAVDANPPAKRDHGSLNRILRKRAPEPQGSSGTKDSNLAGGGGGLFGGEANGAAAAPTDTASDSTTTTPANTNTRLQPTQSSSQTNTLTDTGLFGGGLFPSGTSTTSTTSSTPTNTRSSTTSTTSSTTSTTSSTTSSTPTSTPATTVSSTTDSGTVTLTSSVAAASATESGAPASTATGLTRTTTTILIVIGASLGGIAIIWTVIRKWKLGKSKEFDERMQPIDWQPTEDSGLPTHRRNSNASSFHSGAGHGAGSDNGHGALPDHDFTAGAANLAPVGGYADLARGPSPQPQMADLHRGPSLSHQAYEQPSYDQYGVPLHHQGGGGYDYPRY